MCIKSALKRLKRIDYTMSRVFTEIQNCFAKFRSVSQNYVSRKFEDFRSVSERLKRNFVEFFFKLIKWIDESLILTLQTITGADTGGEGAGAPSPFGALREGPGGATIWLNNGQNSLKTRLKYIKISLKSGSGPHRIFFRGGPRKFLRFAREFSKTQHWSFAPPPLGNPVSAPVQYTRSIYSYIHRSRHNCTGGGGYFLLSDHLIGKLLVVCSLGEDNISVCMYVCILGKIMAFYPQNCNDMR